MSKWLLSIVGIVFVGIILDTIVPNGKLNGYIKGIFSLILLYIVVAPLPKMFNKEVLIGDSYTYEEDINFLQVMNSKKLENYEVDILSRLSDYGISNVFVQFDVDTTKSPLFFKKVYVDISNLVLNDVSENININDTITEIVTDILGVKSEEVVIYGSRD